MNILQQLRKGISSSSPEETERIGAAFAASLPEDCVVALSGDLGSGKTTFVRGLARALGIDAAVTSPTYNICTIYQGTRQLLHMDAYRLADAHELDSLTIDEFLRTPFLIALEWPENIPEFLHEYTVYPLRFHIRGDHSHFIQLQELTAP